MQDFVVSARKYRPQTFDTVVGQQNITQTLLKAIENNHLAQAFLFCGPRGVGKTTCARILARTVNELTDENSSNDIDYSFNIFELDAASNNGVEEIRSLIDAVRVPPQTGKYKVYIIDEVHMLSTQAFNAFLKTLEEPPPYAIFILATTEKHKVLPTILSRCQVFNFSRIEVRDMVLHLRGIATKEGVEIADEALHVIAEKADGALRDALSIFDQVVSFAGNKVSYQDVITNLNVLDHDYYFRFTDAFLAADATRCLLTYNDIIQKGFDGHNFLNGLANHLRNLLFAITPETAVLLEKSEQVQGKYLEQALRCDTRFLLNALNILSEADTAYKQSKNQRLLVELSLLKICNLNGKLAEKKNPDDSVAAPVPQATILKPAPVPAAVITPAYVSKPIVTESRPSPAPQSIAAAHAESEALAAGSSLPRLSPPAPEAPGAEEELADTPDAPPPMVMEPESPARTAPSQAVSAAGKSAAAFSSRLSGLKGTGIASIKSKIPGATPNPGAPETNSIPAVHDEKPSYDFNLAELWKAWENYTVLVKEQDRQSYYATLTNHKPVMREKYMVELVVNNHIQKKDLEEDKSNLVDYLRRALNNGHIQVNAVIEEDDQTVELLYSPDAKFKAMTERNPLLMDFRQQFDLEIDYDG